MWKTLKNSCSSTNCIWCCSFCPFFPCIPRVSADVAVLVVVKPLRIPWRMLRWFILFCKCESFCPPSVLEPCPILLVHRVNVLDGDVSHCSFQYVHSAARSGTWFRCHCKVCASKLWRGLLADVLWRVNNVMIVPI